MYLSPILRSYVKLGMTMLSKVVVNEVGSWTTKSRSRGLCDLPMIWRRLLFIVCVVPLFVLYLNKFWWTHELNLSWLANYLLMHWDWQFKLGAMLIYHLHLVRGYGTDPWQTKKLHNLILCGRASPIYSHFCWGVQWKASLITIYWLASKPSILLGWFG